MSQALAWSSAVITAVAVIVLLMTPAPVSQSGREVSVVDQAPLPSVRCGPRTLEDHGVCVPVPQTHTAESTSHEGAWVPLLPGHPNDLTQYQLPTPGTAEVSSEPRASSPLPALEPGANDVDSSGPMLTLSTDAGMALNAAAFDSAAAPRVLALDAANGWLLLGFATPDAGSQPGYLVLLHGVSGLSALTVGSPLPSTTRLETQARWSLLARQLRPGETLSAGIESWSSERSIPTDPRNLLRLK